MGYDMSVEADQAYFRLNIFGMGTYRDAMEECGMIFWPVSNFDWPKRDDFVSDEAYRAACEEYRDRDFGGVIPGHKTCSNDGWLVTPDECRRAVEAYNDWIEEIGAEYEPEPVPAAIEMDGDVDYWRQWIDYLEHAANNGGFRVW